jgi:GNAT superfamily N-acetyltransferase
MEIHDLLTLYDSQVRARPRALPGLTLEHRGGVLLLTGLFNFVCHWDFSDEDAAEVVAKLAARFRGNAEGLIWDIYGHDRPAGLGDRLAAAGFVQEHVSTLMLMDLGTGAPAMPPGIEVRRVTDRAALKDFVRVSAEAFGKQADWQFDAYAGQLGSDQDLLFNAYVEGEPAGSSRIELNPGCPFAGLFGGAVSPRFQGLGLYRAMVAARAAAAGARGVRYLTTGAQETSRPILQRLGFVPLTGITRWVSAAAE